MTDDTFRCPNCGELIEISEVLSEQIRHELEKEYENRNQQAIGDAIRHAESKLKQEFEDQQRKLGVEMADLQSRLGERERQVKQAEEQELALRKKARELEQKQQAMDIEVARQLDDERNNLARQIREQMDSEYHLQLKEKEKQIEDLRKSVAEIKRKSEVGSQEAQGELLEDDLEISLVRLFPEDMFSPVEKGARGADLVQEVRDGGQRACGSIIWEAKNTKRWSPAWIDKLKDDQREIGASFAILVTVAMPPSIRRFGELDGVWVCDVDSFPGLALALRRHLVDVAFARRASRGKNEKVELVYEYLSGNEFRHRVQAIVESFESMQLQLARERRAMEKLWKEREKQIQRLTTNTVGMYGEMRGIIGSGLAQIPALELDPDDDED